MNTIISPSLLSANFLNLAADIDMINRSEADWLHMDVMDGLFVPNLSFGFPIIEQVGKICKKPLDVHLMIVQPERYVERVARCGAAIMNVHVEACTHLHRTIQEIHAAGMKAAVTLNPSTPVVSAADIVGDVDMILLMSVNPGFGGQAFIAHTIDKVKQLKRLIDEAESNTIIQVDGGVNDKTAPSLVDAGATSLVSGNYIFKSEDPIAAIKGLKQLGETL